MLALVAGLSEPAAAQVSDYEMQYGKTVEVSLDDLIRMPENYVGKAVRTRGQLDIMPGTTRLTYAMRGTFGDRLLIFPVPQAENEFERQARTWVGREVEVTGAVNVSQSLLGRRAVRLHAGLGHPGPAGREEGPA